MLTNAIGRPSPAAPPLQRDVFPVTRRYAYCNHAAVGPLPAPARDAVVAALDAQTSDGCNGILDVEARKEGVRVAAAAAINAVPDEIAFMRSSSDGALLAANGLEWREGDEVIISDDEFGSNAYAWFGLRDLGVDVRLIRAPEHRTTVEQLERIASPRTKLVAVSMVGFLDGYRADIDAIGAWCRARGVLFAIDAMQGFGHLPLDVRRCNADFCYFGVAKWLLAPQGLSVVFVRQELVERLRPALCAWRSVVSPMTFLDYAQPWAPGATRFEGATLNYSAVVGFGESLRILQAAGFDRIERHVLALTDRLIAGADKRGVAVKSARDARVRSGIVLLDRGGASVEALSARADALDVQVTIRDSGVRVSPHGYNDDADIDRVLSLFDEPR